MVQLRSFGLSLLLLAASVILRAPLSAFPQAGQQMPNPTKPSTLVVSGRMPDGSPLDTPAVINLYTFSGTAAGIAVFRSGTAEFVDLAPASYTLEIVAAGYQRFTQNVQIMTPGQRQQLSVSLTPESFQSGISPRPGPPILAPNAEKEVSKALEALRANKPDEARKHLEKASHAAPSHPDISYLWGMYFAQTKDFAKAKVSWEKAVQIAPGHAFSLDALAQLALQNSDYVAATDYLFRDSEAAPSSWRYHERLAEAYLNQKEYEPARKHAQRALEMGKERAAGVQFVLAQISLQRKDSQAALKALQAFLSSQPSGPRAIEARKLVGTLQKPDSGSPPAVNASLIRAEKRSSPFTAPTAELMPPPKWIPRDVDDSMPPVESTAGCPLREIQAEAGKRVRGFVDAVNRIAATESLENEIMNRFGNPGRHTPISFSYV